MPDGRVWVVVSSGEYVVLRKDEEWDSKWLWTHAPHTAQVDKDPAGRKDADDEGWGGPFGH
jgi:hypothetical protein